MPSGLGARVRIIGVPPIVLGTSTAVRYSGQQAGIAVTGVGFPLDVVIQAAPALAPNAWVDQPTTRLSATSLTFDLLRANLWNPGDVSVRASSSGVPISLVSTFAVTQIADLEYEEDPTRGTTFDGTGKLVQLVEQAKGRVMTPLAGHEPTRAAALVNGRDCLAFADSSAEMRNAALGVSLSPSSKLTTYRVIKSVGASAANQGVYGLAIDDGTSAHSYFEGGSSGLLAGETWAQGAGATKRVGTSNLTWAANEVWLEEWKVDHNVSQALTKNGANVALNLSAGGGANMAPAAAAPFGGSEIARIAGSSGFSVGYRVYAMIFKNVILSAAVSAEVRAHMGSLPNIVVT
jgi:hypothetical protein